MKSVAESLVDVQQRIAAACERSDRNPDDVRLVAVSKMQPVAKIVEAYKAGHRVFGENYVQELQGKADVLSEYRDLRWQFIGRLQRNKAKALVRVGVHALNVDSVRLAETLRDKNSVARRIPEVFVQVNVSGEEQKGGCEPSDLASILATIRTTDSLALGGLMTVPPADVDPRPFFAELAIIAKMHGVEGLSMGMSHDFEIAVEEGATEVRVGSAIFGERGVPNVSE